MSKYQQYYNQNNFRVSLTHADIENFNIVLNKQVSDENWRNILTVKPLKYLRHEY